MTQNSESAFNRTLEEKTKEARGALEKCLRQYISLGRNERQAALQATIKAVDVVFQLLLPSDRPEWLSALHNNLQLVEKQPNSHEGTNAMLRVMSELYPQLRNHQWRFSSSVPELGIDFDKIFEKYRAESQLPELFDELVRILEEVIATGEIDSVKELAELRRAIAMLRTAKTGSHMATFAARDFFQAWLQNSGWEILGKTPILGGVIEGFRKTLEDFDLSLGDINKKMRAEFSEAITRDFPRVENFRPSLPALGDTECIEVNVEAVHGIEPKSLPSRE